MGGTTLLQARGGGEYDVSDADIEAFYTETISGNGGDPPKGTIAAELIVKFFYGEFTKQGFCALLRILERPTPRSNRQKGHQNRLPENERLLCKSKHAVRLKGWNRIRG